MNEHIIDLVHGELDGTNSPRQSSSLAEITQQDDEARAYLDETRILFDTLDRVEEAEPPVELYDRIMASVEREASVSIQQKTGFADTLRHFFSPVMARPAWALSYAFVAGLVIGVAALSVVNQGIDTDPGIVQGTIGTPYARTLDSATLSAGTVTAKVATVGIENGVVLDVAVAGLGEASIIIDRFSNADRDASVTVKAPAHFTITLEEESTPTVLLVASGEEQSVQLLTAP